MVRYYKILYNSNLKYFLLYYKNIVRVGNNNINRQQQSYNYYIPYKKLTWREQR